MSAFYHKLTLRLGTGATYTYTRGSIATTLDEAAHERCKIEAGYHKHHLVAISTHDVKQADGGKERRCDNDPTTWSDRRAALYQRWKRV